ncbi:probable magnesium transporter NIPA9 [Olea europaea subsp. europaea]|uniref:Probable magnesium transporter n=1 Tax=Olea europaea subsp. europaea TaxID=158383 RepID=A0A8S0R4Z2_OLEEU|nr:probable magnesium transporter NIPA9 [Olea europaea subsp. europaea]
MWESICLTIAATAGNNIGKVLQKKGTVILPPLSLKLKVIKTYASNKTWIIGFLMDIFGAVLMLRVLSQAPVSVVQPVSGCGLAILSVFSHFYLKETMNTIDWIGISFAGIGTIGVGAGGEEQNSSISIFHLPWLGVIVAFLFVLLNGWLRIYRCRRREQDLVQYEVVEEIIYGLESGILFGVASVISKMGFVFLEQGFSKLLLPICLLISISCSGSGFVYQTRGLKHGRAIVVSTCAAVASIMTGVLAGFGQNTVETCSHQDLQMQDIYSGRCYPTGSFNSAVACPPKAMATFVKKWDGEEFWHQAIGLNPHKRHQS